MASSATSGGQPRRRRMPRADRERQMLAVAEEVFSERGYQDASMDEIARRVGVTKPMLYAYFGSKEGLLAATIARVREQLTGAVMEAIAEASDVEDMLWRGLLAYHEFVAEHERGWVVVRQVASQAVLEQVEEIRRGLARLIADLMAVHAPGAPERHRQAYAEMIVGACERSSLWRQTRDDVTPEQAARLVMEGLWQGVASLAEKYAVKVPARRSELSA